MSIVKSTSKIVIVACPKYIYGDNKEYTTSSDPSHNHPEIDIGIALFPAILCVDNKYHGIRKYKEYEISGDVYENAKPVANVAEALAVLETFKPEGACVALDAFNGSCVYWSKVLPTGELNLYHEKPFSGAQESYTIPLPADKTIVQDGNGNYYGSKWQAKVYWNAVEAVEDRFNNAKDERDVIISFQLCSEHNMQVKLAHGNEVIAKLLAEQEKHKPIEVQIEDKWNAMTTEDKAKALHMRRSTRTSKK